MKKAEMFEIAKRKAATLPVNCQIRVTADEHSYTVYNFEGRKYIGWPVGSPLGKMFKNKPVQQMQNAAGVIINELQSL